MVCCFEILHEQIFARYVDFKIIIWNKTFFSVWHVSIWINLLCFLHKLSIETCNELWSPVSRSVFLIIIWNSFSALHSIQDLWVFKFNSKLFIKVYLLSFFLYFPQQNLMLLNTQFAFLLPIQLLYGNSEQFIFPPSCSNSAFHVHVSNSRSILCSLFQCDSRISYDYAHQPGSVGFVLDNQSCFLQFQTGHHSTVPMVFGKIGVLLICILLYRLNLTRKKYVVPDWPIANFNKDQCEFLAVF